MIHANTSKEDVEALGKECDKCGHCCKYGAGFAQKNELKKIADHLKIDEETLKKEYFDEANVFNKVVYRPKIKKTDGLPFGPCIFMEKNECKIHEVKPLHCRVGNCGEHGESLSEWYTINHLVDKDNMDSLRQWAIRVELKPTIKGGEPKDLVGEEKAKKIFRYKEEKDSEE